MYAIWCTCTEEQDIQSIIIRRQNMPKSKEMSNIYISSVLCTVALLIKVHPGTLVTVKEGPWCPSSPLCKCFLDQLLNFWSTFPHSFPHWANLEGSSSSHDFFLSVQNTSYSTLSISLWALEILALSLGVFSPTWKMGSWIFISQNPNFLFLGNISKCCSPPGQRASSSLWN